MSVNYNKLWKLLIDKDMKKQDLRKKAGLSKGTITKLGKRLDGIIIVKYYIGDEIATNKAYIVSVEDGVAVNVIPSEAVYNTAIPLAMGNMNQDEEKFLQALERFEMQVASGELLKAVKEENDIPEDVALVETRGEYHYDYLTGGLCYTEEYFYQTPGEMGVYIDDVATWIIN